MIDNIAAKVDNVLVVDAGNLYFKKDNVDQGVASEVALNTAYIIVGALPLSVIIIPLILHFRYHSYSNFSDSEELVEVPYLSEK